MTHCLSKDGVDGVDIAAKLAAGCGHCRPDTAARATTQTRSRWRSPHELNIAPMDATVTVLRAIVEHRNDLVKEMEAGPGGHSGTLKSWVVG